MSIDMNLQQIAFAMFAAAAGGGLLFTALISLRKHYPRALAAGHGLLGVSALTVLGYSLSESPAPVPATGWWAIGVLGAACCGGVLLFRVLRLKGRRLSLALMHGSLALLGLVLLYRFVF
jgi:hypothetical protein